MSESELRHQPSSENPVRLIGTQPKEILISARTNPDQFWQENLLAVQKNFSREQFVGPQDKADIVIAVPLHNEDSGDKKGNLRAAIAALSQLQLSVDKRVKIMTVLHNTTDSSGSMLAQATDKIEQIKYDSSLQGFSYPLQAIPLILGPDEATELGVVDADTVVKSDWLVQMHQALHADTGTVAVAGPRRYINQDNQEVMYGQWKHGYEVLAEFINTVAKKDVLPVKLVSGNSFYKLESIQKAMNSIAGDLVTDGLIQATLEKQGGKIISHTPALAYSEGQKFHDDLRGTLLLALSKLKLVRGNFTVNDHIRFIEEDITHYFPGFRQAIAEAQSQKPSDPHAYLQVLQSSISSQIPHVQETFKTDLENIRSQRPYLGIQ